MLVILYLHYYVYIKKMVYYQKIQEECNLRLKEWLSYTDILYA